MIPAKKQFTLAAAPTTGPLPEASRPTAAPRIAFLPNASLPNASLPNASLPNASLPNASLPNATRVTAAPTLETGTVEFVGRAAPQSGRVPVGKGESAQVNPTELVIQVALSFGPVEAALAKSCLVAPEVGDRVLCAVEGENAFVVSVLSGANGSATHIVAQGDLHLQAPHGTLSVSGASGVNVTSLGPIGLAAPELHLRAKKGSVAIEELGFFGRLLQAEVAKVALIADEVDSVLNRLSQRAKRVFRFTEEIEQTRAGTVDIRAQKMLGLRAENAVLSARVLAKVDGEQIHLG